MAIVCISRIPSADPDASDEAAGAGARPLERIALLGAETQRSIDNVKRTLRIGPRQRVHHVDERLHFDVDEATGSRTRGKRLVGVDRPRVERHHVHRGQLLQDAGLGGGAFKLGQLGGQVECVLKYGGGFARSVTSAGGFRAEPQVRDGARPVRRGFELVREPGAASCGWLPYRDSPHSPMWRCSSSISV